MLRLVMRDGEMFEGDTLLDLVRAMKGASMFSDAKGVLDYIEAVARRLERTEGIEIVVGGEEIDERCEAFVLELASAGLATLKIAPDHDLAYTVRMVRKCAEVLNAGDLVGCWAFLRDKIRVTDEERDEIERRLGLAPDAAGKEQKDG